MENEQLGELNMRRMVCKRIISILDGVDDPRKADAMREYKRQLAKIDKGITKITGTPPPIVIGLKTASLAGESKLNQIKMVTRSSRE